MVLPKAPGGVLDSQVVEVLLSCAPGADVQLNLVKGSRSQLRYETFISDDDTEAAVFSHVWPVTLLLLVIVLLFPAAVSSQNFKPTNSLTFTAWTNASRVLRYRPYIKAPKNTLNLA